MFFIFICSFSTNFFRQSKQRTPASRFFVVVAFLIDFSLTKTFLFSIDPVPKATFTFPAFPNEEVQYQVHFLCFSPLFRFACISNSLQIKFARRRRHQEIKETLDLFLNQYKKENLRKSPSGKNTFVFSFSWNDLFSLN